MTDALRYRTRPVEPAEVTALQFTGENVHACVEFGGPDRVIPAHKRLLVRTRFQGPHWCDVGWWLVKTGDGTDVYPLDPVTFEDTLELIPVEVDEPWRPHV